MSDPVQPWLEPTWLVLEELRRHRYDLANKGSKPTDPGWHACSCGAWEGYWCDYQPHVAEQIVGVLARVEVDRHDPSRGLTMATCPSCGANSRTDPTFEITEAFVAKPLGTYSLAGVQNKAVVTRTLRLTHSCGWAVIGHIDGDHFVADAPAPPTS